jgi:hypothetical protein
MNNLILLLERQIVRDPSIDQILEVMDRGVGAYRATELSRLPTGRTATYFPWLGNRGFIAIEGCGPGIASLDRGETGLSVEVVYDVHGEDIYLPSRLFVDRDLVREAVIHFAQHGELKPGLPWVFYDDASLIEPGLPGMRDVPDELSGTGPGSREGAFRDFPADEEISQVLWVEGKPIANPTIEDVLAVFDAGRYAHRVTALARVGSGATDYFPWPGDRGFVQIRDYRDHDPYDYASLDTGQTGLGAAAVYNYVDRRNIYVARRLLVARDLVREAVRHFAEHGGLKPGLPWVRYHHFHEIEAALPEMYAPADQVVGTPPWRPEPPT